MADLYIEGVTTSKSRSGNGVSRRVTGTRDGAIYTLDWVSAMALEGKLFQTSHGTVTTPITFIAYDADRPDFSLDVPTGVAAFLTRIQVHLETSAGTITEIIATTSTNVIGDGTATDLTIFSTRRNSGISSSCLAYGTHTADATVPANTNEFWRAGYAFADTTTDPFKIFEWNYQQGNPQLLVGPAGLQIHVSATTTQATGYIKVAWAELASSEI